MINFRKINKIKYNLKINIFLILTATLISYISLLEGDVQITAQVILENNFKTINNNFSFYSINISKYNKLEFQDYLKLESNSNKITDNDYYKIIDNAYRDANELTFNDLRSSPFGKLALSAKIDVLYPSSWKIVNKSKSTSNIVTFVAPSENNDSQKAAIAIYNMELPYSNISLSEFTKLYINSLGKNYNISTITPQIIDGTSKFHTISYSIDSLGMKGVQAWTIKHDNAFIINYLADKVLYKKYSSLITPIIKSFKIN